MGTKAGFWRKLRQKYMGDASFYKTALLVAMPIMIQNGITQFVALLDNLMVGSVGEAPMSGVGVANQLIFVFNLAVFGAVSGAGIFGAQFFGRGDTEGVRNAFRFKLLVGTVLAAVGILVFLTCGEDLIRLYLQGEGAAENREKTLFYAKQYLYMMLPGLPPFVLSQCYAGTLRETDQTVAPMAAGILSVAVNLTFNTLLIYGVGFFPALGSLGAAVATVIARFVEAAAIVAWAHTKRERCPFLCGAYRSFRIPKTLFRSILRKTVPLMLNETLWAAGTAMLSQCYSLCGLQVVPAYTIASTVSNMFNVAFIAMGTAVGILVGQQLGAGEFEKAVDTDRKLLVFSTGICFGIGGLLSLLSPVIPRLYTAQPPAVQSLAAGMILLSALCMPIGSLANACYFTLRSGGKTFVTFLFDSVYICCLTVPLAFLLWRVGVPILPLFLVCQMADLGKCVVGLFLIKKGVWIQNIAEKEALPLAEDGKTA